jgi:hypothetical protein
MNNQSSYCGLVDAKIRASDKDLPVAASPDGKYSSVSIFVFCRAEKFVKTLDSKT